jgi:hypothetical protein
VVIPGTASATDAWSPPTDVATASDLTSVSCASASFCAATDFFGNAYVYYGGDEWTAPEALDTSSVGMSAPYDPASVSCSSASFCLVVGDDQNYTNYAYTYNGSSWSAPTSVPGQSSWGNGTQMQSVSCVSASFCMAVDLYGAAFLYSGSPASWSGPTTITASSTDYLNSVSCASTNFCVAVDNQGEAYIYNNGTWGTGVLVSPSAALNSVSCPSSTFCAAVDVNGNAYFFNSGSWDGPQSTPTNQGLTSVSCPSGSPENFCATAGSDDNDYANAYIYSQTSTNWTTTSLSLMAINSSLYSISCPTETFCAASSGGDVLTYGVPIPALQTLGASLAGDGSGTVSSSPAGINCDSACSAQFDKPDQVTLSETPATGSTFAGWSGGDCSGTQTTCQVTMSADESVTATFDPIPQTLTVADEGSGSGTIGSSPSGVSCGSICSAQFNQTSQVTLTETPAPGSTFAGWGGSGCLGTQATCQVTMTAAESVTATFSTTPAAAATVTATPTPSAAATPASLSITSISLTNRTVTWCWGSGCKYPSTRMLFDLNKPTTVRLVLSRHDRDGWQRVATARIKGHAGINRPRVAGRWNGALVPAGPVQIALQVEKNRRWTTSQTLGLIVLHDHRTKPSRTSML